MTLSENDTLLSFIALRHTQGLEDVATDALSFILTRSDSARGALSDFLGDGGGPLPIKTVKTQAFLEESYAYPDMALEDSDGNLSAYIEAKFWAPLTHHQPVTYWEALPKDKRTVLLFIAPKIRVDEEYLWNELVGKLREAGHELGVETRNENVISAKATSDQRSLMITSWKHLLQKLADRVEQAGHAQAQFEIAEVQALATTAVEGMRDTQNDKFKSLLAEAVARLRESGWANTDGLAVGQGFGYYGRYLRLAGIYAWLGAVDEVVKQAPDKLLWLSLYNDTGNVTLAEVRSKLASRVESWPGLLSWMRVNVSIPLPQGADREATLNAIVSELESIARLIDPNGPTYLQTLAQ